MSQSGYFKFGTYVDDGSDSDNNGKVVVK